MSKRSRSDNKSNKKLKINDGQPNLEESQEVPPLQGWIYQLKLLMLFLKRGIDNEYSFRLSTEKKEAKKFDDLVFEINKNGQIEYRLLQAKHSTKQLKKITLYSLLKERNGDYNLVKYFFSYQDCKREQFFKNGVIKDVTICTNIDLDLGHKDKFNGVSTAIRNLVQKIEEDDDILYYSRGNPDKEPIRYRFRSDTVLLLKPKLLENYINRLAKRLVECLLKNKPMDHHDENDIFKPYHTVLVKEVIDVKSKKFFDAFLCATDLSGGAIDFRNAFEKEVKGQSRGKLSLDNINFKIGESDIGLNLVPGFGVGGDDNWLNVIPDKDVEDFFDHLVLAVNQPNEKVLGKIIEKDIGKEYNFADLGYIYYAFFEKMLNWFKGKEGEFLSYQDGKSFFEVAEQNLRQLELNGLAQEYKSKVNEFGIEFNSSAIQEVGLDNFLASQNSIKKVFNVISQESTLSAIKVYQVFQDINRSQDNYIFMQLDSVLRLQDHVTKAFKGNCNVLVIECQSAEKEENVQLLYNELSTVLQSSYKKKVVLITKKNRSLLTNKFKFNIGNKYQEKNDEKNSLTDLTLNSQKKLLSEQVIFQGEKISLGSLIEERLKHLIDAEVLSMLINKEKIEIGRALTDSNYDSLKDYYIDRTFIHRIMYIERGLKEANDFFVIEKQINNSNPQSNQDIVLISETKEDFKKLCNKYKKRNIHWLKRKGVDFMWQQTQGSLSKLRKFAFECFVQEYKPEKISDITERVVIISAEPGMGKSTLLTSLALKTKESDPSLWVVKINLLDQSERFCKWQENETNIADLQALTFLYSAIDFRIFRENGEQTKETMIDNVLNLVSIADNGRIALKNGGIKINGLNMLEVSLFNHFYEQGKIILLLDGFDEICSEYKHQFIELLDAFRGTKTEKIWVTTRPYNIQSELENMLGTFSYALKPFLKEEQQIFLKTFWERNREPGELDEQCLEVFIDKLLHIFFESTNDQEREFGGMPLHLVMIAEIYSVELKKYLSGEINVEKNFDLVNLYKRFLDINFNRQLEKSFHDLNRSKPHVRILINETYRNYEKDHKLLAVYTLFGVGRLESILSQLEIDEVHAFIGRLKQAGEMTGVIVRIINGKPYFTHRTFAEYLATSYLWEKFQSIQYNEIENFIDEIIIEDLILKDRVQICKFFALNTQKDLEMNIHFSFKEDKLEMLLIKLVIEINDYGPVADKTLQSTKLLLNVIEFCLPAEEESDSRMIKNVQKVESSKTLALLSISAEMGYKKIANALLINKDCLESRLRRCKWWYSPLWLAAKSGHLDFMREILIKKLSYTSSWKDKDNKNLLQRIFLKLDFDVLRSCLKLDLVDVRTTFEDLNELNASPLIESLMNNAPSDVIELLIEKTDIGCINELKFKEIPAVVHVIGYLIRYEKKFLDVLVEKDINLNAGHFANGIRNKTPINVITFEFQSSSLCVPEYKYGEPQFFRYFFYSDKEFSKFFNLVQSLLEYGAIYNLVDDLEFNGRTILQILKQTCYIRELFKAAFQTWDKENDIVSNLLDKMLCYKKQSVEGIFFIPEYIEYLLSKAHNSFTECTLIKDSLNELKNYVEMYHQKMEKLKYGGYDVPDVLEKLENGNILTNGLLERVLTLYIHQNYELDEAYAEVREEALKLNKKKECYVKNLDTDEVVNTQDIENIISKIEECKGLQWLKEYVLLKLNDLGQKNRKEVLESILRFSEQSSLTLELLKTIDDLFDATNTNNMESVVRIVQDADPRFLNTVTKVHNKERKTLLDLAKELNNSEIEDYLRRNGAKYSDECRQRNPSTFTPQSYPVADCIIQ